jgi:hypothetical protein
MFPVGWMEGMDGNGWGDTLRGRRGAVKAPHRAPRGSATRFRRADPARVPAAKKKPGIAGLFRETGACVT